MPKLSVSKQKKLIPDYDVYRAFLRRPDIKKLKRSEKLKRWKEHKVHLDNFRKQLTQINCVIV